MNLNLCAGSLALLAAFGLSACGGDSASSPDPTLTSSATAYYSSVVTPINSSSSVYDGVSSSSEAALSSSSMAVLSSSSSTPVATSSMNSAFIDAATGGTTSGVFPTTADQSVTSSLYDTWKAFHYITLNEEASRYPTWGAEFSTVFGAYTAQGMTAARVIWSTFNSAGCTIAEASGSNMYKRGCTVSEGIGYGMLITLFEGDLEAFNALWVYNQAYRNSAYASGRGLMPWLVSSFGWDIPDVSSATDADLDIATSLVLAYYKTGNTGYLNDALTLINALWDNEVNTSNNLLYSGDTPTWKAAANPSYNLSYFSPVALRLFAVVDKNHD